VSANFELPFDLNKLCHYNFNFDVLKEAIEFLAKQQGEMNQRVTTLENLDKTGPLSTTHATSMDTTGGVSLGDFLALKN